MPLPYPRKSCITTMGFYEEETMFKTTLTFVKVTKGTVVFGDESDGALIRMLYINKNAFSDESNYPAMIEVEVKGVA